LVVLFDFPMPLVNDRCICLRIIEYSETSQIVTLFSRQFGLFRAIAKGAHRRTKLGASKFDGGMDFLELGDAVFTHDPARDLATLTEWGLKDGHLDLRTNLRGLYLGLYGAELVSQLIEEHDPHAELFDRLEAALTRLGTFRREQVFLAFELDLLRQSGYLPEVSVCVSCGSSQRGLTPQDKAFFSPGRGGVVCQSCQGLVPDCQEIDPRLIRLIQGMLHVLVQPRAEGLLPPLPHLERRHTDPINRLLAAHIENTLHRPLKLKPYVVD
jgi:DNA repair protein RecO (recombination protein O)